MDLKEMMDALQQIDAALQALQGDRGPWPTELAKAEGLIQRAQRDLVTARQEIQTVHRRADLIPRVQAEMRRLGINQTQLAAAVGVSRNFISVTLKARTPGDAIAQKLEDWLKASKRRKTKE